MRLWLLAITWIMTIAVEAADLVERNRRTIGSLFTDSNRKEDFDLFGNLRHTITTTTETDLRAAHTIILDRAQNSKLNKRSARKTLESIDGPELFQDSNDIIDPESLKPHIRVKRRTNFRRSIGKSPSYVHRVPRTTYERFLSEEMNPADESEAEYGGNLDDDVDVPGVILDDEITLKRNRLEDVYPEVKFHPLKRDHSPPEFLKPESVARQKRDKERDGECVYEEDGEEYYYDDEDETSNQMDEKRASPVIAPKAASPVSTVEEAVDQSQSNQADMQTFENNQKANIKEVDYLNYPAKEEYAAAAVKGTSSVKKPNSSKHKNEKPKPRKKPPAPKKTNNNQKSSSKNKPHSQKQFTKEKTKSIPKPKHKLNKKSKSSVGAVVNNESDQLEGQNQKGYAECCGEATEKERNRKIKTLVIKAVPKSESLEKLQIYEKQSNSKKVEVNKPAAKSKEEIERKAEMSMGEVKDLLTSLIGKVDDLHNLVSEIRSDRVDRLECNSNHINCIAKARRRAADAGG